jgi:hypothetical protein
LRVQSSNNRYPAVAKSILDPSALLRTGFGFRPNQRSNLRNQFAMRRLPFFALHLLNKIQILLPTTVRLAPTTHLEERSLPIGGPVQQRIFHQAEIDNPAGAAIFRA